AVFSNHGGIRLDDTTGANNLQSSPLLTSAAHSSGNVVIQGTLSSTASTTFTLEFSANSALDPIGLAEGERSLGTRTVTTDAGGNATFTFTFTPSPTNPDVPRGQSITATATDPHNNPSAFSAAVVLDPNPPPVTVAGTASTLENTAVNLNALANVS